MAEQKKIAEASSRLPSGASTPKKGGTKKSGTDTPRKADARLLDLAALNITSEESAPLVDEPPPKITIAREKVLEEAMEALEAKEQKKSVSLVVIGRHFVSSCSTLGSYHPQVTSTLESRRSWEGCCTNLARWTRRSALRTKELAAKLERVASAGPGSLTARRRNESG